MMMKRVAKKAGNSFFPLKTKKKRGFAASLFFSCLVLVSCGKDMGEKEFNRGEKEKASGRYEVAIKAYRQVALHYEKSPLAPEALFQIGQIQYKYLKNYAASIDSFRRLIANYPWSEKCKLAQKYLAHIYMYNLHDDKQAIVEYQKAIGYYAGEEEAEHFQYEITNAYFNLKNFEQQRVELKMLLSMFPDTELKERVYYQVANSYYVEGKLTDAIREYNAIIDRFPHTPYAVEATFQLAICHEEQEDLQGAIKILKKIQGIYPNPQIVENRIKRINRRLKKRHR
ncbi:MAG: tetratricopeptide repeat protein [Deltaproteobacteria bacterium]|nr:tetratricopeptide repeat protein [Deltaproteobacteria bacterium]